MLNELWYKCALKDPTENEKCLEKAKPVRDDFQFLFDAIIDYVYDQVSGKNKYYFYANGFTNSTKAEFRRNHCYKSSYRRSSFLARCDIPYKGANDLYDICNKNWMETRALLDKFIGDLKQLFGAAYQKSKLTMQKWSKEIAVSKRPNNLSN